LLQPYDGNVTIRQTLAVVRQPRPRTSETRPRPVTL